MFYPDDAGELRAMACEFIGQAAPSGLEPRAAVSPHAGYIYSGPIAGHVFRALRNLEDTVKRVLLLGPAHRVRVRSLAACSWDAFATPLGEVPIDQPGRAALAELPQVQVFDQAHLLEHSLEVQLPFLQCTFADFSIIPLAVGAATAEEISEVMDRVAGPETLILVSSDLSHYHPYKDAQALDAETSRAIERLAGEEIQEHQACGVRPIQGLLSYARRHGLTGRTICLANSGDTAGSHDEVVGYGAYVFV